MTDSPLCVGVAELLRRPGSSRDLHLVVAAADVGPVRTADAEIEPGSRVTIDVRLDAHPGYIDVVGRISTRWLGACRRCLEPIRGDLDAAVDERFAVRPELHPDHDAYPIADDRIDLAALTFEALTLELPLVPVCSPQCPGPDPVGHPIQVGSIADRPVDPRWAALDELRDRGI